tara:strand:+ start:3666 stop:5810 length:2145 start_codon:yes stop_codon:yes gene_type:complete
MKQLVQNLKTGKTQLGQAPIPRVKNGHVLIQSEMSLISFGTEKMLLEFSKASIFAKAKQQPERVKQVLDKIKSDGIFETYDAISQKLSDPLPLGYSNVGTIIEIGEDVRNLKVGDRIVSNAPHAEFASVVENLCCRVPSTVSVETAVFTVVSSIALEAIRLAKPNLGERYVVQGVGLVGLIAVQLLLANGCSVLAVDVNNERLKIAKGYGADVHRFKDSLSLQHAAQKFSRDTGCDGVLITADAPNEPLVNHAADCLKKRGSIVLVGTADLKLDRKKFYEKELNFQVSSSYGPGRYEYDYEVENIDYPFSYVRWTAQRNFEAILDLMAAGSIRTRELITEKFDFIDAPTIYPELLSSNKQLGVLIDYSLGKQNISRTVATGKTSLSQTPGKFQKDHVIGLIGNGNYASRFLIPAIKKTNTRLHTTTFSKANSLIFDDETHDFEFTTTSLEEILTNTEIGSVFIATQHNSHADITAKALNQGKNVFVEKPLATTINDLDKVRLALEKSSGTLTVGFNRRFSPHGRKIKSLLLEEPQPKNVVMTINAGSLPNDHWVNDPKIGGGRIIGECCHFIDFIRYIIGSPILNFSGRLMAYDLSNQSVSADSQVTLNFEDGSAGTIHYVTNGHKSFPKERLEIFVGNKVLVLDNFRNLRGFGWRNFKAQSLFRQNKGQQNCVSEFINCVTDSKPLPIPIEELFEVAEVTIKVAEQVARATRK